MLLVEEINRTRQWLEGVRPSALNEPHRNGINFFFFLKNGPTPASFCLFSSFQTHITNFTTNMNVKKCPSSIRRWDSNSQPCDYESPPLTTRPGLPPSSSLRSFWKSRSLQKQSYSVGRKHCVQIGRFFLFYFNSLAITIGKNSPK